MKFKKIMLISFILLAILTIGAVSANDDTSFNETLTQETVQETADVSFDENTILGELSEDEVNIEVNNIDRGASDASFVDVSLPENEGSFVIYKVEGDDNKELFRQDISTVDDTGEDDLYHLEVSFDDVNAYIEDAYGGDNFDDIVQQDDMIQFVLEYQDDDLLTRTYAVDFDGDQIIFDEFDESQNFDDNWWWVSTHDTINNRENHIIRADDLEEGSIAVTVTNSNGESRDYEKGVDDKNKENGIVWTLDDLDFIDEFGFYNITVVYRNGDEEQILEENTTFQLTLLSIDTCWYDNVHVLYPYDVLRIYDEEVNFRVYVNGTPYGFGKENPFRWTLDDLGIDSPGEYEIVIDAIDEEDNPIDTFSYSLNVCDDEELLIFLDYGEIIDVNEPALSIYCPDGFQTTVTIRIVDSSEEAIFEDTFELAEEWNQWTLDDFGIDHDDWYNLFIEDSEGEEYDTPGLNVCHLDENKFDAEVYGEIFYTDYVDSVMGIYIPRFKSGKLEVVADGVTKYVTLANPDTNYDWNLVTLNITELGSHSILVKFIDGDYEETLLDETIVVTSFENQTFRAKLIHDYRDFALFVPEGSIGTINVSIYDFEGEFMDEFTYEINSTYYNKWTGFSYDDYDLIDYDIYVDIDGTDVHVERGWNPDSYGFYVNDEEINEYDVAIGAYIPFDKNVTDFTLNVTSKDYMFSKTFTEDDEYEWNGMAYYQYSFSLSDLGLLGSLEDKDMIIVTVSYYNGKSTGYFSLQENDETFRFIQGNIGLNPWIELLCVDNEDEDDEDEGEEDSENVDDSSMDDAPFAGIIIPFDYNITEAQITITDGDKVLFTKNVFDIENKEYDYEIPGYLYIISFGELNFSGVKDKDVINAILTSNGKVIDDQMILYHIDEDENVEFYEFRSDVEFNVHYGELSNPKHGMDIFDGTFIILDIPSHLNITEGTIEITDNDGNVYFTKSLSSFDDSSESYYSADYFEYEFNEYVIYANESFYNTYIPKDVNLTFSFTYGGNNTLFMRGVRKGDELYKIITKEDLDRLFTITIEDKVLVDGNGAAIHIAAADANRQSIYIDVGGGHFNVYVNGKKVEDLGRLVRVDGETDLELFRLTGHQDAWEDLYIYLADLNITENGIYDIKVTHSPKDTHGDLSDDDEDYKIYTETELYHNSNLTLTSNVKVNYQNGSVELLTGFGLNPVLLYLDTYYDSIDDVTGKITVLNSAGEEIFSSDIKSLASDEHGRYLSYMDFREDNFGDRITVIYSDGNQRSGETTLDVLWRNATVDDFIPTINDNVNDYYGDLVNLNIPDVINDGQLIVTIKFKNNHGANISNMNVTTDFDSQAVYKFNIADIKANYGNDFALALSDLGFFEDNGDYDVDVKFTAGGTEMLDITNSTVNVEFLHDILITISEDAIYGLKLPFASVQIFEPMSAYAELFIDGKLYSHKNFEKGLIVFDSSPSWAPGIHAAELIVYNSEFGTVLNSSSAIFETLTSSEDVGVSINEGVKENEHVFVNITVPKAEKATIKVDGEKSTHDLAEGLNTIDLGVLSHGNHTIWISYNVTLDDGNVSFYNNYLTLFVGDDGHWMNLPQPLVLDNDDTIRFDLGSDSEGYVLVIIDGKLYDNKTLINGSVDVQITESMFSDDNKYGIHTYNITYSGDKTHDSLSQTGNFTVTYLFKDDINDEGYPLMEYYVVVIYLPSDANGSVNMEVNGKQYFKQVENGKAIFNVPGLSEGEYPVDISYSGDAIYPDMSYSNILNVSYYAVVGEIAGDNKFISLMLPANATGNLTVYNDNRRSVLFTKELINGKARIDLSDLPVGIYDLMAYYDGDDYDVRTFTGSFKVLPKVYITPEVIIGDNVTVTMDLNQATGSILIVVDGLTPAIQDIVDGKINYSFSTEDLAYGNHTIYFNYFGTSFDSDVFNEVNENGRYVPVLYHWTALPKIVNPKLDSDDRMAYISVGNATGTIEVLIDGTSYAIVEIVNGIACIDLSAFANGQYKITWKYSGDDKYAPFTKEEIHTVNNRIVASNLNALYTANQKYSVTVYGSEGNAMSGIAVSFLINNKAYGSATTDSKGVASIVIKNNPGTYTITAKTTGVGVTKKLTVTHVVNLKKVNVKKSAKKLVLTATLKKVNGKYLKNKKVTFKFNGKKYTAKTNKKGIAKVTIKSSILKKLKVGKKITYQATYLKDTVKRSVKVKK